MYLIVNVCWGKYIHLLKYILQCLLSGEIIGHSLSISIHNPKYFLAAVNGAEINLKYSVVNGTCWNLPLKCICQKTFHLGSWEKRNKTWILQAPTRYPKETEPSLLSQFFVLFTNCILHLDNSLHRQPSPL